MRSLIKAYNAQKVQCDIYYFVQSLNNLYGLKLFFHFRNFREKTRSEKRQKSQKSLKSSQFPAIIIGWIGN